MRSTCVVVAMLATWLGSINFAPAASSTLTYPPSYYVSRPTYYEPPFPPNSDTGFGTYWIPDRPVSNSGSRHRPVPSHR
jgi:hypothetical protein